MDKFIIELGTMSFQASIVIGVVLLVRFLFARMHVPKKYMCILWIVPYLCMLCPWKLESEFGFWQNTEYMRIEELQENLQIEEWQERVPEEYVSEESAPEEPIAEGAQFEQMQSIGKETEGLVNLGEDVVADIPGKALDSGIVTAAVSDDGKTTVVPTVEYSRTALSLYTILCFIWLAGVLSFFTYNVAAYFKLRRNLVCSICNADNIYVADDIEVPFVLGIIKPRIYLPSDMPEESAEYVLAHEKTHIRRRDPLKKMLALCISTLHWFNPLSWVAFVFMVKDMEMACDEETIFQLGLEHKKDYAGALLTLSSGKRSLLGAPIAFDEGDVKGRICNILRYKKTWKIVSGFAVALIVALTVAFLTKRAGEEEGTQDKVMHQLVQYQVDLTGDDVDEQIVFEVAAEEALGLTDTEILEPIWTGKLDIIVKVWDGDVLLWEEAFSGKEGITGNLAVCNDTYNATYGPCLLRYDNEVSDGKGRFWYELLYFESGKEPIIAASNEAIYDVVDVAKLEGQKLSAEYIAMVEQVLLVEEELQEYLRRAGVKGRLLNITDNPEACYLYQADANTWRNAFDTFALQAEGTGAEWKLEDYFYPKNPEGTTVLPEDARARILAGEILCMDVTEENDTAGNLDLDGDGQTERIYLEAVDGYEMHGKKQVIRRGQYRIRVNDAYFEEYGDVVRPQVMLFSPDGATILLAVYDDGPSADPCTSFYRYDTGERQVYEAGYVTGDLLELEIDKERVIACSYRADMIETQFIKGYWIWDGKQIVLRDDGVYEYYQYTERYSDDGTSWKGGYIKLKETLTVYAERNEESEAFTMKPQNVYCVSTDLKEWIYLEAEDGTKGWLRVEFFGKIPSLGGKDSREVFDGLGFAG